MSASYENDRTPYPFGLPGGPAAQESTPRLAINRLQKPAPQPTHPYPTHWDQPPLSPTEQTVLGHLVAGLTERKAAEKMQRSHNTVHVHVRNIYRKLGVTKRKVLIQLVKQNPHLFPGIDIHGTDEGHSAAA